MEYQKEMDLAISMSRNPVELVERLSAIDQRYPGKAEIKAQLGVAYLMSGQVDQAEACLLAAERNIGPFTKRDVVYLVYGALADVDVKKGLYEPAVKYSSKALDTGVEDSLGVLVLRARAEAASGNTERAFESYKSARASLRRFMNAQDYDFVILTQANGGNWSAARDTYLEKMATIGYAPGNGLELSLIYEKNGDFARSLSASAFELWRLSDEGKLDAHDATRRLDEVTSTALQYLDAGSKPRFEDLVRGYKAVFDGKWDDAASAFARRQSAGADCFELYALVVSASLSSKHRAPETLTAMTALEPFFVSYQPYYCHFWRAIKTARGSYSFDDARPVFEKTLSLGYDTPLAVLTRAEMARLLGLTPADAERLIPPNGVADLVESYYASGNTEILTPVCDLLSLPNNRYTSEALRVLGLYSGDESLKSALVASVRNRNKLFDLRIADVFGRL